MTAKVKRMLPRVRVRVFFSWGVRSSDVGRVSRILLGADCWMQIVCAFGA